ARKDVDGRLALAESSLEMSRDRAQWSERMLKKGFLTANQSRDEFSRLQTSRVALDNVREEYRVLEQYTRRRTLVELESAKLAEARRTLERCRRQARAR